MHTHLHTYTRTHTYARAATHALDTNPVDTRKDALYLYMCTRKYTYIHTYVHASIHRYVRAHVRTYTLFIHREARGWRGPKGAVGRSRVALAGDIIINLFAHVKGNGIIYFIYVHNRCIKRLITLID